MSANGRTRAGALLGAFAGPIIVILFLYPLFEPRVLAAMKARQAPILTIVAMLASWVAGIVGLPILGACVVSGSWIGRTLARRMARWCIGGGVAGGMLSVVLARTIPALRGGEAGGAVLRLSCIGAGLVGAMLLLFRDDKDPPPA